MKIILKFLKGMLIGVGIIIAMVLLVVISAIVAIAFTNYFTPSYATPFYQFGGSLFVALILCCGILAASEK
ncbi:hypothetical protein FDH01_gp264 [Acinetobacter phage vB_AbaM_ME3]|uniref:Uncharacterized protein n=1 Tax=Acinetobacter phage vB_AbaM_ME3 TaxID=1837876 RepID=A0A172Q0G9_9CAUD|nr:hypothetical protein FDH01_gp264 [Acinetobacter phage vB_AbaM_ME3]AND75358.1 hypothetical protein ME3_197 [Acinetobacter phage vB_AbaM_ME3]